MSEYKIALPDGNTLSFDDRESMHDHANEQKWLLIPEGGYEQDLSAVKTFIPAKSIVTTIVTTYEGRTVSSAPTPIDMPC